MLQTLSPFPHRAQLHQRRESHKNKTRHDTTSFRQVFGILSSSLEARSDHHGAGKRSYRPRDGDLVKKWQQGKFQPDGNLRFLLSIQFSPGGDRSSKGIRSLAHRPDLYCAGHNFRYCSSPEPVRIPNQLRLHRNWLLPQLRDDGTPDLRDHWN